MHPPFVLKLGGSLEQSAQAIIDILREQSPPILIVPGGGRYADEVRRAKLPEKISHWMAIAAMDMFGWQLSSFGVEVTGKLEIPQKPGILLPYSIMRATDPLPHSWDITSDTIAAWTAHQLGVDLIMAKSVDGIRDRGLLMDEIHSHIETDVVDPCFIRYVVSHGIPTFVVNGKRPERIRTLLAGGKPPGTNIGATF